MIDVLVQRSAIATGAPVAYAVAMGMTDTVGMIRVTSTSVPEVVWASAQIPTHKTPETWVLVDRPPVGCGSDCALYARKRGGTVVFGYLHRHARRELPPISTGRWVPEPSGAWSRPHVPPRRQASNDPRPGWEQAYVMEIDDRVQYAPGREAPTRALMEVRVVTRERQADGLDAPVTHILQRSPVDVERGLVLVTSARPGGGYRTVLVDAVAHTEVEVFAARRLTRKRALTRHFGALAHLKRGGSPESFIPTLSND
jgi:hypothetical protein